MFTSQGASNMLVDFIFVLCLMLVKQCDCSEILSVDDGGAFLEKFIKGNHDGSNPTALLFTAPAKICKEQNKADCESQKLALSFPLLIGMYAAEEYQKQHIKEDEDEESSTMAPEQLKPTYTTVIIYCKDPQRRCMPKNYHTPRFTTIKEGVMISKAGNPRVRRSLLDHPENFLDVVTNPDSNRTTTSEPSTTPINFSRFRINTEKHANSKEDEHKVKIKIKRNEHSSATQYITVDKTKAHTPATNVSTTKKKRTTDRKSSQKTSTTAKATTTKKTFLVEPYKRKEIARHKPAQKRRVENKGNRELKVEPYKTKKPKRITSKHKETLLKYFTDVDITKYKKHTVDREARRKIFKTLQKYLAKKKKQKTYTLRNSDVKNLRNISRNSSHLRNNEGNNEHNENDGKNDDYDMADVRNSADVSKENYKEMSIERAQMSSKFEPSTKYLSRIDDRSLSSFAVKKMNYIQRYQTQPKRFKIKYNGVSKPGELSQLVKDDHFDFNKTTPTNKYKTKWGRQVPYLIEYNSESSKNSLVASDRERQKSNKTINITGRQPFETAATRDDRKTNRQSSDKIKIKNVLRDRKQQAAKSKSTNPYKQNGYNSKSDIDEQPSMSGLMMTKDMTLNQLLNTDKEVQSGFSIDIDEKRQDVQSSESKKTKENKPVTITSNEGRFKEISNHLSTELDEKSPSTQLAGEISKTTPNIGRFKKISMGKSLESYEKGKNTMNKETSSENNPNVNNPSEVIDDKSEELEDKERKIDIAETTDISNQKTADAGDFKLIQNDQSAEFSTKEMKIQSSEAQVSTKNNLKKKLGSIGRIKNVSKGPVMESLEREKHIQSAERNTMARNRPLKHTPIAGRFKKVTNNNVPEVDEKVQKSSESTRFIDKESPKHYTVQKDAQISDVERHKSDVSDEAFDSKPKPTKYWSSKKPSKESLSSNKYKDVSKGHSSEASDVRNIENDIEEDQNDNSQNNQERDSNESEESGKQPSKKKTTLKGLSNLHERDTKTRNIPGLVKIPKELLSIPKNSELRYKKRVPEFYLMVV